MSRKTFGKMVAFSLLTFVFAISSCGDIKDAIKDQQDKNKNDDKEEPCQTNLDPDKVSAQIGPISSGVDMVVGEPGATDPGATVTVTDADGNSVERTANDDGSFAVPISALDYKRGECVTVTVKNGDCDPATMQVCVHRP